jgi:hypothetical protein
MSPCSQLRATFNPGSRKAPLSMTIRNGSWTGWIRRYCPGVPPSPRLPPFLYDTCSAGRRRPFPCCCSTTTSMSTLRATPWRRDASALLLSPRSRPATQVGADKSPARRPTRVTNWATPVPSAVWLFGTGVGAPLRRAGPLVRSESSGSRVSSASQEASTAASFEPPSAEEVRLAPHRLVWVTWPQLQDAAAGRLRASRSKRSAPCWNR